MSDDLENFEGCDIPGKCQFCGLHTYCESVSDTRAIRAAAFAAGAGLFFGVVSGIILMGEILRWR